MVTFIKGVALETEMNSWIQDLMRRWCEWNPSMEDEQKGEIKDGKGTFGLGTEMGQGR